MRKKELGFCLLGAGIALTAAACSDGSSACGKAVAQEKYQEAFPLCVSLAKQGDVKAQNDLGWMYEQGKGVAKDYARALDWYRRAAKGNYNVAQTNLGLMYAKGLGVRKDYVQAGKWYFVAAAQGDIDGLRNLALLREEMSESQMEEAQNLAQNWMQKQQ